MSFNFCGSLGILLQHIADFLEFIMIGGFDVRLVGIKLYVQLDTLAWHLGFDGAAVRIDLVPKWSAGAFVKIVRHSIPVGIDRAACCIDGYAGWSVGAFVKVVRYSILVGI